MKVLFEDEDLIVFIKDAGIDSEKIKYSDIYPNKEHPLFCVHRLDKEVSGITIYAKNEKMAAMLSKGFENRTIKKTYLALCSGYFEQKEGVMEDLLYHDKRTNKTFVVDKQRTNVKKASLDYKVLKENNDLSLVEVHLHTGRSHQIRVQFASRKHPLVNDRRYGSKVKADHIGLWSYSLQFTHPITKEEMLMKLETQYINY